MAIREIITIPNPTLTTPTEKIGCFGEETKKLVEDMLDTVRSARDPEGAGLAATQIGINKRICVVRDFFVNPEDRDELISKDYVLINPKVISTSKETDIEIEGCLSVPNKYGKVERFKKIKIKAMDENGNEIRMSASGFLARVVQHEIDHLDGILFTSKIIGKIYTDSELEKLGESY